MTDAVATNVTVGSGARLFRRRLSKSGYDRDRLFRRRRDSDKEDSGISLSEDIDDSVGKCQVTLSSEVSFDSLRRNHSQPWFLFPSASLDRNANRTTQEFTNDFTDLEDTSRRRTAPVRKHLSSPTSLIPRPQTAGEGDPFSSDSDRPGTAIHLHEWNIFTPRASLSRYAPLPAIGSKFAEPNYDSEEEFAYVDDLLTKIRIGRGVDDDTNSNDGSESSEGDSLLDEIIVPTSSSDIPIEKDEKRRGRPVLRSETFTIDRPKQDIKRPVLRRTFVDFQPTTSPPSPGSLKLAVKLPSGTRVTGHFSVEDMLQNVLDFVQDQCEETVGLCQFVTNDVPKKVYAEMSTTLREAGIQDKTVLYLQEV